MSTATTPTQALAPVYTCQICHRSLTLNGPPIIGEQPEQRLVRVAEALATHMGESHKKELGELIVAGNHISGMFLIDRFQHNDTALALQSNELRLRLRRMTKRVNITDELIEQQAGVFLATPEFQANPHHAIVQLLKGIRDSLDEAPIPTPKKG